jgi:hypothetical protein
VILLILMIYIADKIIEILNILDRIDFKIRVEEIFNKEKDKENEN